MTSLMVKELSGDCQVAQKLETTVPLLIGLGFLIICMSTSPPVAQTKIVEVWRSDREVIDVGRASSTRCVVEKTVEGPQLQIVEKTAKTPEIQMVRGTQTSESLGIVPEHQPAQAETVKKDKIVAPLFYRIRIAHVRPDARLGGSSSCWCMYNPLPCGVICMENVDPSAKSTWRRECARGFRVHSSVAKSEASILSCQAIESAMVEPLGRWSCVSVQPVS